jgi:hypothetical protein
MDAFQHEPGGDLGEFFGLDFVEASAEDKVRSPGSGVRGRGDRGLGLGTRARAGTLRLGLQIVLDFPTSNCETMINAVFRRWTARKGWRESGPERGLFICGRALR